MMKKYLDELITKSQIYLQLDIKFFAKAGTYHIVQQTIGIVSGFIISYFFGHFASKKLFGDYNLILAVVSFLTFVTLPGLDNYLIRSIGRKFDTSYLRAIKYKLFASAIGIPILLTFSIYYFFIDQSLSAGFIISALFFPILAPVQLFIEFFTAKQKFKFIAIFLSFSSILSAFLIAISVLFTKSLNMILISYFLGILTPSVCGFIYSLRFIGKTNKVDRDLLSYGLFMTFLTALPWSVSYLGPIILATFLGTELLAVFIVAHKLPLYVHKNLFVFHKPITAKLASQTNKQHIETLKKHSLKLIIWGIMLAVPLYLLSPSIIKIIFTEKYAQAIPLAQLLSLTVIPLPITWVIDDIMVFQKIKKPQLYATTFINIVKILLYIALIPVFKLYGLVAVYFFDRYTTPIVYYIVVKFHNRKLKPGG